MKSGSEFGHCLQLVSIDSAPAGKK